jgi:hypothetical protein
MKYPAVGGLGALLGLVVGLVLGARMASSALERMQDLTTEGGTCGMPIVAGMLMGALGGSTTGAIVGVVAAMILPNPTSNRSAAARWRV